MAVAANANALTTAALLRTFLADSLTADTTGRLSADNLQTLINEASSAIERWCGARLIVNSSDFTYTFDGHGEAYLYLPDRPIVSVTSVTLNQSQLTVPASATVNDPGWYLTDEGKRGGRIELYGYTADLGPRGVTVLAKCGFSASLAAGTASPEQAHHLAGLDALRRACNTLCGTWFENRLARSSQTVEGQSVSFDSGTMPERVVELLRPYRMEVLR